MICGGRRYRRRWDRRKEERGSWVGDRKNQSQIVIPVCFLAGIQRALGGSLRAHECLCCHPGFVLGRGPGASAALPSAMKMSYAYCRPFWVSPPRGALDPRLRGDDNQERPIGVRLPSRYASEPGSSALWEEAMERTSAFVVTPVWFWTGVRAPLRHTGGARAVLLSVVLQVVRHQWGTLDSCLRRNDNQQRMTTSSLPAGARSCGVM